MFHRLQLFLLGTALMAVPAGAATPPGSPLSLDTVNAAPFAADMLGSKDIDPALIKLDVLLDRAHASPGVIDGRAGENLDKAIAIFRTQHNLPGKDGVDAALWQALGGETPAPPVLMAYTITPEDAAGPFTPDIPNDYALQAKLPHLAYRNVKEMLAERFHMDEKLLDALNPGATWTASTTVTVADVTSAPLTTRVARIDVDKTLGQVRAYDDKNTLVVAYSATIGSTDLPSPSGTYRVKGVAKDPVYSYDPAKNFQQGKNTGKLTLPSGPNNPVGIVYIALTKKTYGIHGTPDPSLIDKAHSHGCVRLTNWSAQELAHLVRNSTVVRFLGKGA